MDFSELKLTRQFLNAIADAGYEEPTPIQKKAIPPLRSGQDVIGIAQTGTGKTAAFLLPILQQLKYAQGESPRALVLAPTKELAVQIHAEAEKFAHYTDLRIVAFYGGVGPQKTNRSHCKRRRPHSGDSGPIFWRFIPTVMYRPKS